MLRLFLVVLLSSIGACSGCPGEKSASGPVQAPAGETGGKPGIETGAHEGAAKGPSGEVDPRSVLALVEAMDRANGEPDLERRATALAKVRSDWVGRRYRWEVRYDPTLCARASACHVMPFDRAKFLGRVAHGWLPRLALDEQGFERLKHACAEHSRCVVRVEATLERFALSLTDSTSLLLSDVTIEAARSAAPGESWMRSPSKRR